MLRRFVVTEWGGSESAVYHLSRKLIERGAVSEIYCTDIMSHPGKEIYAGVVVKRFSYIFPWFGLDRKTKRQMELKGGSPLSWSLFWALLREPGLSIIHTHVQLRLGGIVRTVARLRGIPYVVSIHGGHFTLPPDQSKRMLEPFSAKWEWGKLFGWLLGSRRVLEDANAIICVGRDEYDLMRSRYPNKYVKYIPNGVDVEQFQRADPRLFRERLSLAEDEKFILCVSRIDYQKNQLLLLRAFSRFYQQFPQYRLVCIGPITVEDYHRELLDRAENLGIRDRFTIVPGLAQDDPLLASAYKAADLFVLPSVTEPFGIVILEAWAAGVPVIASNVGGIPGFTQDGKDVYLFPSEDEEMLLQLMIEVTRSRDVAEQLVASGYEAVYDYDWTYHADQVLEVYRQIK